MVENKLNALLKSLHATLHVIYEPHTEVMRDLVAAQALAAAPVVAQIDLHENKQYRMQMAGISTAALGYWTEAEGIHPDYDTVPLRDVAKLYAKYAALAATQPAAAPDGASKPTDISQRLRETADQQPGWKPLLTVAADEIERYYGGMMAWKRTAEAKDAAPSVPAAPILPMSAFGAFDAVLRAIECNDTITATQIREVYAHELAVARGAVDACCAAPSIPAAMGAKPVLMAYIATDLDGHADVALTIEEAKRRAGPSCDTIIALHDISTEYVELEGKPVSSAPAVLPAAMGAVTHEAVRAAFTKHLGWLGAREWSDEIAAIVAELAPPVSASAPIEAPSAAPATQVAAMEAQDALDPDYQPTKWMPEDELRQWIVDAGYGNLTPADVICDLEVLVRQKDAALSAPASPSAAPMGQLRKIVAGPQIITIDGKTTILRPDPEAPGGFRVSSGQSLSIIRDQEGE